MLKAAYSALVRLYEIQQWGDINHCPMVCIYFLGYFLRYSRSQIHVKMQVSRAG